MGRKELVNSSIDYIMQHLDEDLSLDTISSQFYISKYHFSRIFKDETGESIYVFMKRCRVDQSAIDISLLQKNGAKIKMPTYRIVGEDVSLAEEVHIKIQGQYFLPLKLSSILRKKLGISQREFDMLLSNNRIQSNTEKDLRKCRLTSEIIISIFQQPNQLKHGGKYI